MRTIYTTFPIYNATAKQDVSLTDTPYALPVPRHALPPFQFESDDTQINDIELIGCDNVSQGCYPEPYYDEFTSSGAANTYDTWVATGMVVSTGVKTQTATSAKALNSNNNIHVSSGDRIEIVYDLTLNSGSAPKFAISNGLTFNPISTIATAQSGANTAYIDVTSNYVLARFALYNATAETCSFALDIKSVYIGRGNFNAAFWKSNPVINNWNPAGGGMGHYIRIFE